MGFRSWTWAHLALTTVVYWAALAVGSWLYWGRPSRQAKARAAAPPQVVPGEYPGEELHVYSGQINLGLVLFVVLAPPVLLWVVWGLFA